MEGLFNPLTILLHMVNAAILFVAVYFLLYKPVRKFMRAREDKVAAQLDDALKASEQAHTVLEQSRLKLDQTSRDVADKLTEGQKRVQVQQQVMLEDAHKQGALIIENAQKEADLLMKHAHDSMQRQASELAIAIAAAVLEREVSKADHQQLIAEFLKKVG